MYVIASYIQASLQWHTSVEKMENCHIGENNKRIYVILFLFSLKRLVITVLSIIYTLLEVSGNQNKLDYSRKHFSFHQHNYNAFYLFKNGPL